MTLTTFRRYHHVLQPSGDEARETLEAIKNGAEVMVEVKAARNPRQHRLFFALLKLLVDNSDRFDSVPHALIEVKLACHEYDLYVSLDGKTYYVPRSIAFHSMPQDKFKRLFDRTVFVICSKWLVGTDQDDLRREVYALIDGPQAIGERAA